MQSEAEGCGHTEAEVRESKAITIKVGSQEVAILKASSPESDRGEFHNSVGASAEAEFDRLAKADLTTGVRSEGPSEHRVHKAEGRSTTLAKDDRS
ncbi:hypothetical protein GUJ93_ZPchr0002g24160 [Zizania palustris]|uniref:Uncharacterized protein n=1 Tax=Zizania palustris TaxID=103762 RepID=A0A8J5ST56_ZIZPA|nr:hypothetical protein GUJ93_ZPchr0002g24160 [Zizania palustris]